MKKVIITGASGLIGNALTNHLLNNSFDVRHISRSKNKKSLVKTFNWDINKEYLEEGALENVNHIVHLAGAGIADKRWTSQRKNEIIDSRTKSAELLFNEIKKLDKKPESFISASAIGYYGAVTSDKVFKEEDNPANDFQGTVCSLWEESADKFTTIGIRTVKLRFGVVLSEKGGALVKMLTPTNFGLGSALGKGDQYLPWVHIDDVLGIIVKAMNDSNLNGSFNVVAPSFNKYGEFAKTLAEVLKKPFFMPNVPEFILKLALGEMAEIVLEGSRISSDKIINTGYEFIFPNLKLALEDLLNN